MNATRVARAPASRKRGRPRLASPKRHVTLRLDAAIVAHFEAMGPGWQTCINTVLADYVQQEQTKSTGAHHGMDHS